MLYLLKKAINRIVRTYRFFWHPLEVAERLILDHKSNEVIDRLVFREEAIDAAVRQFGRERAVDILLSRFNGDDAVSAVVRQFGLKPTVTSLLSTPSAEQAIDVALDFLALFGRTEKIAAHIVDRIVNEAITPCHYSVFWGDRLLTLDKSAAFRDDPTFQRAFRATSGLTGATQYASPDGISWRLNTLIWALRMVNDLPGDIVECGVYKGDMSWVLTEIQEASGYGKNFYLYDTFDGFSPEYSSVDDFPMNPGFFEFADKEYRDPNRFEEVTQRFAQKPYVKVIKGVVPDILEEISPSQIALLHLDMNSPSPEVKALEVLFDRIVPGGIIVLDDYGWKVHRSQMDAADGFAAARGYRILELPTGQGLMVKR